MFKVMIFIKRKTGLSDASFVDHYESTHAPLGLSKVPNIKRYIRHYLHSYGNDTYGQDSGFPYDVVTELGFDDRADFERGMAYLTDPATAAIIAEDEEKLFERSSIRFMIVEDRESDIKSKQ
jgi:uncharacterized protein (TIGR02118 family)